jgi:hypothetical protein
VNIVLLIFILIVLPIGVYASTLSQSYTRNIVAILTEDGTCADATQKDADTHTLNNSGINGSFKNLTSDNRQLAEIICQSIMNGKGTSNLSISNHS